jgi:hypothetical protein
MNLFKKFIVPLLFAASLAHADSSGWMELGDVEYDPELEYESGMVVTIGEFISGNPLGPEAPGPIMSLFCKDESIRLSINLRASMRTGTLENTTLLIGWDGDEPYEILAPFMGVEYNVVDWETSDVLSDFIPLLLKHDRLRVQVQFKGRESPGIAEFNIAGGSREIRKVCGNELKAIDEMTGVQP